MDRTTTTLSHLGLVSGMFDEIEALSMIIVLCLFLYSIAQWKLRSRLKEINKYIHNQVKKPSQNPTMKWVFSLFRRITELTIPVDGTV